MKLEGKSELFRMLAPSRSATPSIDYPGPRVYGVLSPDDKDDPEGIDFQCEVCRKTFYVPYDEYHGQWDHPPNEPICPECESDRESRE